MLLGGSGQKNGTWMKADIEPGVQGLHETDDGDDFNNREDEFSFTITFDTE